MRHRKYLKTFFCVFLLVFIVRGAVAVVFDPFADFYFLTGLSFPEVHTVDQLSERKIKVRLIEDTPSGDIDVAIIGNSRSVIIDPTTELFLSFTKNGYNLGYSAATLEGIRFMIKRLKNRHPKALPFVAIDFDHCMFARGGKTQLYLDEALNSESRWDALYRLFSLDAVFQDLLKSGEYPMTISQRGQVISAFDYSDQTRIKERAAIDKAIYKQSFMASSFKPSCLDILKDIRNIAPDTIFFSHPLSVSMREAIRDAGKQKDFEAWRQALSSLGRVVDFTCSADLTEWPMAFSDAQHFSRELGDLIASDLLAFRSQLPIKYGCAVP